MDIILRIKSIFNKDGQEEAVKGVDQLSASTDKAAAKTNQAKVASVGASQGFAAAGQAASAASSGGIGPLTSAMGGLSQQIPALAKHAGTVGLLVAAFAAWKQVIDAVNEAHEQMKKDIDAIQFGNLESNLKSLTAQYAAMRDEITETYERSKMLYDFEKQRDDAQTAQQLAILERDALKKKSENLDDPFHSRKVDVDTAVERSRILAAADDRSYRRDSAQREAERIAAIQQKTTAAQELAESEQSFRSYTSLADQRRAEAQQKKDKVLLGDYRPGITGDIDKDLASKLEKIGEKIAAAADAMKAANERGKQADLALQKITQQTEIASIQKGTGNVEQQSASEKNKSSGSAIVRDQQKADDKKRRELIDDQIDRLKSEAANRVKNADWKADQFDAADFKHADQGTRQQARIKDKRLDQQAAYVKQLQQQLADAEAAADAIPLEKFGQSISSIKAKLNRLENAFQNLPNN